MQRRVSCQERLLRMNDTILGGSAIVVLNGDGLRCLLLRCITICLIACENIAQSFKLCCLSYGLNSLYHEIKLHDDEIIAREKFLSIAFL